MSTSIKSRIAGAPISWGVCEVPGWGYQLEPARVLAEMRDLGLAATEFGPDGFLERDPQRKAAQLAAYEMKAVGGFVPVLLHDPDYDPLPHVDAFIDACIASGAGVVVLAAFTGVDGYDDRPELDELGWKTLLANLDRLSDHAESRGVIASLHPHMGTMVESASEVVRVLEGSKVGLCIDTGHIVVGGGDPVALTTAHAHRVTHVHLKDVDQILADRVIAGELPFQSAVKAGIFRPLGQGDVDIAAHGDHSRGSRLQGWYVLEQDVMLDGEPTGPGPVTNVRACLDYLLEAVA